MNKAASLPLEQCPFEKAVEVSHKIILRHCRIRLPREREFAMPQNYRFCILLPTLLTALSHILFQ